MTLRRRPHARRQNRPHPSGRADLVQWISEGLDKTPGETGLRRLIEDYPAHRASLGMLSDIHSEN